MQSPDVNKIERVGRLALASLFAVGVLAMVTPVQAMSQSTLGPGGFVDHWLDDVERIGAIEVLDRSAAPPSATPGSGAETVEGAFGSLRVGRGTVGSYEAAQTDAAIDQTLDLQGLRSGGLGGDPSVGPPQAAATRVIWFSPRVDGVQLGLSYGQQATGDQPLHALLDRADDGGEKLSLGANYLNSFKNVEILFSGGLSAGSDQELLGPAQRGTEYNIGAQVGFAGFTVGGSFQTLDGGFALSSRAFDVGVGYTAGSAAISLSYRGSGIAGLGAAFADDRDDMVVLSSRYNFRPGVAWKASLFYADWQDEGRSNDRSNDGWAVVTGIRLDF